MTKGRGALALPLRGILVRLLFNFQGEKLNTFFSALHCRLKCVTYLKKKYEEGHEIFEEGPSS